MICVIRIIDGEERTIPLFNQSDYREWPGCFCLIDTKDI